jgi:hypothetical protein
MCTNHDDMPDTTAGSPKTHDSTSPTPGIPSPVYRAMHSVELTFVSADDECSEAAAARPPACCPSDAGQVSCNTPKHAGSRQPSPVDTGLAPPGRQETSDRVSHDALLAEVRLRHAGARRQRTYKLESEF